MGKVLERCIHSHLNTFLKSNNIISESQSGFTEGDSTINQLIVIYNDLCKAHDQKITTQAIYFDISKAFDRVWHSGLLKKLDAIGIRGNMLYFLKNYLSCRRQCVSLKGSLSDTQIIPAGVPQGSVLGPLLFLVYINDITESIQSNIKLFADDTSISQSHTNPTFRAQVLNSDLEAVSQWAANWKINFNATKTELMTIKRDNKVIEPLIFNNTTLNEVSEHKHLGLVLQNNCKWDRHIHNLIKKITPLLSCLKSYKYRLSRRSLDRIYRTFILPIFDYADIIYDGCADYLSEELEKYNLEAIRTIIGLVKGTSRDKLYQESGHTSLKERRKRHKLIMFHKIIHQNCPTYLSNLCPPLVADMNPYHRRRPLERFVPRCNSEIYSKSFIPSTTRLYNELPDGIKTSPSISLLKHHLRCNDPIVPVYFYHGNRKEQLLHTRLRLGMSDLNYDLYNRHLRNNTNCACGFENENVEHYLLNCPNYINVRANTIDTLPIELRTVQILLHGKQELNLQTNTNIFDIVQNYIKQTNRF